MRDESDRSCLLHPSSLIPHPFKQEGPAMTDNPRLRQLLDELHDSHAMPEEVCRSCPELLPEVRARWRAVCRVRAELDALFPAPTVRGVGAPARLPPVDSLPQVPGYNV